MLRTTAFLFHIFSTIAYGDDLPNELFNIELTSNVSSLNGVTKKRKGCSEN